MRYWRGGLKPPKIPRDSQGSMAAASAAFIASLRKQTQEIQNMCVIVGAPVYQLFKQNLAASSSVSACK